MTDSTGYCYLGCVDYYCRRRFKGEGQMFGDILDSRLGDIDAMSCDVNIIETY